MTRSALRCDVPYLFRINDSHLSLVFCCILMHYALHSIYTVHITYAVVQCTSMKTSRQTSSGLSYCCNKKGAIFMVHSLSLCVYTLLYAIFIFYASFTLYTLSMLYVCMYTVASVLFVLIYRINVCWC